MQNSLFCCENILVNMCKDNFLMKPIIASLLTLLLATPNGAQTNFKEGEGNWRFGLNLGSKLHRIDDIKTTMIREFIDQSTYSAESQYRLEWSEELIYGMEYRVEKYRFR